MEAEKTSKRLTVILWASVGAAAAGIAAVVAVTRWKSRSHEGSNEQTRLRNVQDVLADCYKKIHEIEEHLPELYAASRAGTVSAQVRMLSNGSLN